jgi:iron complex transport system permease protein
MQQVSAYHLHQLAQKKALRISISLIILIICISITSLKFGAVTFSWQDLFEQNHLIWQLVYDLRLPRIMLTLIVGFGLAVTGAIMQGLMRNPMADPGLLGISSGASLLAMTFLIVTNHYVVPELFANWGMASSAFLGSLIVTTVTYLLSCKKGHSQVGFLLLAGVAINSLCGALIGLLYYMANDDIIRSITFWSMGSFSQSNYIIVMFIFCAFLICTILLRNIGRFLNTLLIGESYALQLGINIKREKIKIIIAISIFVGTATAFIGPIGFIGLVVPHIVRLIIGNEQKLLMITSGLAGALIITASDLLARTLASPAEIPIGIITSLIGAPYFIYLLLKSKLGS